MRLINTLTLRIEQFYSNVLDYAILSHTWEGEEVTLQEFQSQKCDGKFGYEKIRGFCQHVLAQGWSYVWVDTVCIDKTSSADLSEAINSMFAWYHDAKICWAYLSDIAMSDVSTDQAVTLDDLLRQSRWFTRGWTLQELLAPDEVNFYNKEWQQIGTKTSLRSLLQQITGVRDFANYQQAPVAQKFSWAAKRETTRIEDTAYSLLGIFGVNMPLLYGEGSRAFIRLQMEILNESDDETIFAWGPSEAGEEGTVAGLLATSPRQFRDCADIEREAFDEARPAWGMTNHGFQFSAYAYPAMDFRTSSASLRGLVMIPLNCCRAADKRLLTIFCQRVGNPSLPALRGYRRVVMAPRYYLNRKPLSLDFGSAPKERTTMAFSLSPLISHEPVETVNLDDGKAFFICFDFASLDFYGFRVANCTRYFIEHGPTAYTRRSNNEVFGVSCNLVICGYLNDLKLHMDQVVGYCDYYANTIPTSEIVWVVEPQHARESPLQVYIAWVVDKGFVVRVAQNSHDSYFGGDFVHAYYHICPQVLETQATYRFPNNVSVTATVAKFSCHLYGSLSKILITASKTPAT